MKSARCLFVGPLLFTSPDCRTSKSHRVSTIQRGMRCIFVIDATHQKDVTVVEDGTLLLQDTKVADFLNSKRLVNVHVGGKGIGGRWLFAHCYCYANSSYVLCTVPRALQVSILAIWPNLVVSKSCKQRWSTDY